MPDGVSIDPDAWVHAVFGIDPRQSQPDEPGGGAPVRGKAVAAVPANPNTPVGRAASDPACWRKGVGAALTRQGTGRPGARINVPSPAGPPKNCTAPDGRTVRITTAKDGSVALTRTPPPITEITFSGGGGKGAALPGAVRALEASGVMKGATTLRGASVGSLTAAVLAAGATADDFKAVSDDTNFKALVFEGKTVPYHVSGEGFEQLVRVTMNTAIGKQIAKFKAETKSSGKALPPGAEDVFARVAKKMKDGEGPSFGDLRDLSKIIPAIKEVAITGTMMGSSDVPKHGHPPGKIKESKPQSIVFDADTQPDMDVARAVHASAALPPVFERVDIPMQDHSIGRFQDGGVLNNAPTALNTGRDRDVDPVPETSNMTFVFQDETTQPLVEGKATASRQWVGDKLTDAEFSAAEYGTNRGLADRPDEVMVVPLKFPRPDGKLADYSGTKGTFKFDMPKADRVTLQSMTEKATEAHLERRQEKETLGFASPAQMLACAAREDLAAMAAGGYPGAKDALAFRDTVAKQVKALEALAGGGAGPQDPKVRAILKTVDGLAKGDQDRVAFIGRELNRSGKLDGLLSAARGADGPDALAAGIEVNKMLAARTTAQRILRDIVYPKMVREERGIGGTLLAQMDTLLRDARSGAEINRALRLGIKHFSHRMDPAGLLGHIKFVNDLTRQLQAED